MNVKKIRYDSWGKYSWIRTFILCEFLSLKEEVTIESFIIGVIITIAVSVPVEIIALRNSLKYDTVKIFYFESVINAAALGCFSVIKLKCTKS